MSTVEIKKLMRRMAVLQWEVAAELGVAESTLCRWLRGPLEKKRQELVVAAIKAASDKKWK